MPLHLMTVTRIVVFLEPGPFAQGRICLNTICNLHSDFEARLEQRLKDKWKVIYDGPPTEEGQVNSKQSSADIRITVDPQAVGFSAKGFCTSIGEHLPYLNEENRDDDYK